ncbi:MAG: hypothetical protein GY841_05090 [FCB group bacterium]|nr:hypothetical protein [FCB group bacterium]
MKRFITFALFLSIYILTTYASAEYNCYGVVVGKDASTSGKVIMGHNEDDSGPQVVNHHKIPRIIHEPGEKVTLLNGGQLDQTDTTWAYIWSEMPGMRFSDAYVNEWGVAIASDACPSCEDKPELTDGGISYMLRRLVAERSKSSREGVHLAGELVERFGYDASGRTYLITDADEGWLFCAVNGKHWLAARVPDDKVAIIANTYSVREVDLSDTVNFLAADDIIKYAIDRDWYDPKISGEFDFARVYSNPSVAADSANFCRQWGGLRHVAADSIPLQQDLPFSVKPKAKSNIFSVMMILRDHYEDTDLYAADSVTGCPHQTGVRSICTETTRNSVVIQYRDVDTIELDPAIYWVSLGRPCTSPFVPFYVSITNFPPGYSSRWDAPSEEFIRKMIEEPVLDFDAAHDGFWNFIKLDHKFCRSYSEVSPKVIEIISSFEQHAIAEQVELEKKISDLLANNAGLSNQDHGFQNLLLKYSSTFFIAPMEELARLKVR